MGYKAEKTDLGVVDRGVSGSEQNGRCGRRGNQQKIIFRSEKKENMWGMYI
jgi:hypothetical protein